MILTGKSDLVLSVSAPLATKKSSSWQANLILSYITEGSQLLTTNCKQERRNSSVGLCEKNVSVIG